MSKQAQNHLVSLILIILLGAAFLIPTEVPSVHDEQLATAVPTIPLVANSPHSRPAGQGVNVDTLVALPPAAPVYRRQPANQESGNATIPIHTPLPELSDGREVTSLQQPTFVVSPIPVGPIPVSPATVGSASAGTAPGVLTSIDPTLPATTFSPALPAVGPATGSESQPPPATTGTTAGSLPNPQQATIGSLDRFDGITTDSHTPMRSGPGLAYPPTAVLSEITAVAITGQADGWLAVATGNGLHGWVRREAVAATPYMDWSAVPYQEANLTAADRLYGAEAITRHTAQVRLEASLESPITSLNIPAGTPLKLAARDGLGLWVAVADQQGAAGWVLSSSLRFAPNFQIGSLPVTDFGRDEPAAVAPAPHFGWGAQTHNIRGNGSLAAEMGASWIKVQYKWHDYSQARDVIDLIEQAHKRGLKILLAIPGQPYPSHIDYPAYTTFLRDVASQQPAPDAIEVWNEMNIDFEWPAGEIDPVTYVNKMLAPAYRAIKAANPDILVISGAPAPTGFDDGVHAWADDRYIMAWLRQGQPNMPTVLAFTITPAPPHRRPLPVIRPEIIMAGILCLRCGSTMRSLVSSCLSALPNWAT
jgi:SH3-like domain-containing protein